MLSDATYIRHIYEAIKLIEEFTKDQTHESFVSNKLVSSAVVRQFEIIGEAATKLSDEAEASIEAPWRDIRDMRNNLIHEYFGIDLNIVWDAIEQDLPPLKTVIEKYISTHG